MQYYNEHSPTDLEEAFDLFDTDKSGFISLKELQVIMLRPVDKGEEVPFTKDDVKAMFNKADVNGDGQLSIQGIERKTISFSLFIKTKDNVNYIITCQNYKFY